jgi:hypothetical protein
MLRFFLAAGATALCLAVPAAAQNTMSGPSNSTTPSATPAMTCDQMMAQANRMSMSATGARMTMAQNERHMATMAKEKGDEAGCKTHMEKAMKLMT